MSTKSAPKTALAIVGKPFAPGFDARRGRGPAPGTGGRPPNAIREACREIADRYQLTELMGKIASAEHVEARDRIQAAKLILSYAFGAPTQVIEHSGTNGEEIEFRVKIDGAVDPL